MRAMILAAGLGTRLRPLTFARPKALVPVLGMPVLDYWIFRLAAEGFEAVVVNAYHLGAELADHVRNRTWPVPVEVRTEPVLLGTGGGIGNVADFFGREPFVVVNGDILCNAPLGDLMAEHVASGRSASLLLHDCPRFNNVVVDEGNRILGFGGEAVRGKRDGEKIRAFTGIHFINPEIFDGYPKGEPGEILPLYRALMDRGEHPGVVSRQGLFWREVGSVEAYLRVTEELCGTREGFLSPLTTGRKVLIHEDASVGASARIAGFAVVGPGCVVEDGAELENVVLWNGVRVEEGAVLKESVVADGERVSGERIGEAIWSGTP